MPTWLLLQLGRTAAAQARSRSGSGSNSSACHLRSVELGSHDVQRKVPPCQGGRAGQLDGRAAHERQLPAACGAHEVGGSVHRHPHARQLAAHPHLQILHAAQHKRAVAAQRHKHCRADVWARMRGGRVFKEAGGRWAGGQIHTPARHASRDCNCCRMPTCRHFAVGLHVERPPGLELCCCAAVGCGLAVDGQQRAR